MKGMKFFYVLKTNEGNIIQDTVRARTKLDASKKIANKHKDTPYYLEILQDTFEAIHQKVGVTY